MFCEFFFLNSCVFSPNLIPVVFNFLKCPQTMSSSTTYSIYCMFYLRIDKKSRNLEIVLKIKITHQLTSCLILSVIFSTQLSFGGREGGGGEDGGREGCTVGGG